MKILTTITYRQVNDYMIPDPNVILFNNELIEKHSMESPYDLVKNGKWTIDKLGEMARAVTAPYDDNPDWTHKDKYGFLVNHNFISSMFIGAGLRFTDKDSNDEPIITVYSEGSAKVFEKIFNLVNDPTACGQIDNTARKINGKRAYEYARKGEEVEMKTKTLVIDEIELLEYNMPEIVVRVVCSKGTYIRALARDIGEALNSGGHLTALRRTQIGDIRVENCRQYEDFVNNINNIIT